MANHKGSEGTVKVGSDTIAEITGFTFDERANTIEDTELGDSAQTFQVGLTNWSGTVDCHWDETDSSGQGAMSIGSSITLNLYPEGAASTDTYYSGTALITGITRQASRDGMVEASYTFQGTGALSELTVT